EGSHRIQAGVQLPRRAALRGTLVLVLRRDSLALCASLRTVVELSPQRRNLLPARLELLAVAVAVERLTHNMPEVRSLLGREPTPAQLGDGLLGGGDWRLVEHSRGTHPGVRLRERVKLDVAVRLDLGLRPLPARSNGGVRSTEPVDSRVDSGCFRWTAQFASTVQEKVDGLLAQPGSAVAVTHLMVCGSPYGWQPCPTCTFGSCAA